MSELHKTGPAPQPKAANVARGLEGIIANTTRLSDVIGDKGQLVYSGYDIDDLAGKVSYKEVVYLLWKGKLPNRRARPSRCWDFMIRISTKKRRGK
jgi:citrate synthase